MNANPEIENDVVPESPLEKTEEEFEVPESQQENVPESQQENVQKEEETQKPNIQDDSAPLPTRGISNTVIGYMIMSGLSGCMRAEEDEPNNQDDDDENSETSTRGEEPNNQDDDDETSTEADEPLSILRDAATGPCDAANTIIESVIKSGLLSCDSESLSSASPSDRNLKRTRSDSVVECGNKSARMESL